MGVEMKQNFLDVRDVSKKTTAKALLEAFMTSNDQKKAAGGKYVDIADIPARGQLANMLATEKRAAGHDHSPTAADFDKLYKEHNRNSVGGKNVTAVAKRDGGQPAELPSCESFCCLEPHGTLQEATSEDVQTPIEKATVAGNDVPSNRRRSRCDRRRHRASTPPHLAPPGGCCPWYQIFHLVPGLAPFGTGPAHFVTKSHE